MIARALVLGPEFDRFVDDTEETLVGSSLHQGAITALYDGLTYCGPLRGLPWFVGNQLTLIIPRGGGRPPAQPSPDILVHPTLTAAARSSLNVAEDGSPALVVEVVSPATALGRDLNPDAPHGKPRLYAAIAVPEYLAFDPLGDIIPERVRAWHLGPTGLYVPWLPDERGRWQSALGIAFAVEGSFLRIYDQDGNLVPLYHETVRALNRRNWELAERDRELAARDRELAARDAALAALQAELRRLRGEQ